MSNTFWLNQLFLTYWLASSSAATTSDSKGRKPRLAGRSKSVGTPNKAISSTVSTLGPQDDSMF